MTTATLDYTFEHYKTLSASRPTGIYQDSKLFELLGHQWQIRLYPNGYTDPDKLSVFIIYVPSDAEDEISARFSVSICNSDVTKSICVVSDSMYKFNTINNGIGWLNFCPMSRLSDEYDGLTFKVVMSSDLMANVDPWIDSQLMQFKSTPIESNLNILQQMYRTGFMVDLTVIVGEECFFGHKVVLSLASTQIRRMLLADPDISQISLDEISPEMFRMILAYIYDGQICIKTPVHVTLFDLIVASRRLGVDGIGQTIVKNDHNICTLLNAAVATNDAALRKSCLKYIMTATDAFGYLQVSDKISLDSLALVLSRLVHKHRTFITEPARTINSVEGCSPTELLIMSVNLYVCRFIHSFASDADIPMLIRDGKCDLLFRRVDPLPLIQQMYKYDPYLDRYREIRDKFMQAV